jgi:mycothiol synthase
VPATEPINISMYRPHLHDVPDTPAVPDSYSLRRLEHGDEPNLAALLSLAFAETWDEQRVGSVLTRAEDVKAIYGVLWQSELVATASSQFLPRQDPHAGFVHWVATHPGHRGVGLASAVLVRLLKDFEARGYRSARLSTQPERLPAIRTYLKFGFVPDYEVDGRDDRGCWSGIFQALASLKR